MRGASPDELTLVKERLARLASQRGLGIPAASLTGVEATTSVTPRGTQLLRASLVIDESTVLFFTKELGRGRLDREAFTLIGVETDSFVMLDADEYIKAVRRYGAGPNASLAAIQASSCCTPPGGPLGKCCRHNFWALVDCCGPCVFTLPSAPAFLACAGIWCNYCILRTCREFWKIC